MKKTYSEKLKDPRWQKKRLEVLERAGWKCQRCGTNESELHVHHKAYVRNREPWDYKDWNFVAVCDDCHEIEHLRTHAMHSFMALFDLHIDIGMAFDKCPKKMRGLADIIKLMCQKIYNEEI